MRLRGARAQDRRRARVEAGAVAGRAALLGVVPLLCAAAALGLALGGCAKGREAARAPSPPAAPEAADSSSVNIWKSQYAQHMEQWQVLFQGEDSPLPEDRRAAFPGQDFYPYDPHWRLVGDLIRNRPVHTILVPDTKGRQQVYYDYGRYPIALGARVDTLRVYRPGDHPEQYFIAFRDSTNGGETYGGGRYAHLDSLGEHRFVLDFNYCYNPYCAYDTLWVCPLPPPENALPVAVRAGMMKPPGGHP
jgi:uncharacterized protein (DUF1684 family)